MNNKNNTLSSMWRNFANTWWPLIIGMIALFVPLPLKYADFRLFAIWLSLIIIGIICLVKKEIPRIPPFPPTKGRSAIIQIILYLIVISSMGVIYVLATIFGW